MGFRHPKWLTYGGCFYCLDFLFLIIKLLPFVTLYIIVSMNIKAPFKTRKVRSIFGSV
jgi:hypothetical protein